MFFLFFYVNYNESNNIKITIKNLSLELFSQEASRENTIIKIAVTRTQCPKPYCKGYWTKQIDQSFQVQRYLSILKLHANRNLYKFTSY